MCSGSEVGSYFRRTDCVSLNSRLECDKEERKVSGFGSDHRESGSPRLSRAHGLCREGLGFRVQGSELRVQGSGFRVQSSGRRVQGSGFRVQGAGYRVWL